MEKDSIWDKTVYEAMEWTLLALEKLHPYIENYITFNFQCPQLTPVIQVKSKLSIQLSFADILKKICVPISGLSYITLLGITENARIEREQPILLKNSTWFDVNMSGRKLLELVGTECFRALDPDIWIKLTKRFINQSLHLQIVISDVRFKNEADMIREMSGVLFVVARNPEELVLTESDKCTHPSKWEFLTFMDKKRDIIIINDSTIETLYNNIKLKLK